MNKLYSVHDHWTDINKKNDVDIESIDGVITGIKVNGEDYGGSITWESVYSGSIDPEGEVSPFTADVSLTMTATDLIKVVYDGVEYVLPKQVFNEKIYYGAEPASLPANIDFTNYPFLIQVSPEIIRVYTETAGVHTLTISEPASGGESDVSTAEVSVINNSQSDAFNIIMAVIMTQGGISATTGVVIGTPVGETEVFNVMLYKGNAHIQFKTEESPFVITTSGNISEMGGGSYMVTGDCTITIS